VNKLPSVIFDFVLVKLLTNSEALNVSVEFSKVGTVDNFEELFIYFKFIFEAASGLFCLLVSTINS